MKDKLEKLKSDLGKLDDYYKQYPELEKIITSLKIYTAQLFPREKLEWEKRIDAIDFVSYAATFTGYDHDRDMEYFQKGTSRLQNLIDLIIEQMPSFASNSKQKEFNLNVFIVHGHDIAMREQVSSFLQTLGLNPIVLSDCTNGGNTIIEKLEANSNVGYAVKKCWLQN